MPKIEDLIGEDSWRPEVYALPKGQDKYERAEWDAIAKVVKKRDRNTCQSCRIKVSLGVHHIIPREEGGTDYPPNLITLCDFCHDEIEELGLRNRLEIVDFNQKRKYIKGRIKETEIATKWQKWVYGGYRRPTT